MRRIVSRCLARMLCILPLLLLLPGSSSSAQIVPRSVGIMAEFGPALYLGEFNSLDQQSIFAPNSGYDASFGLKYNVARNFTFIALLGFSGTRYEVNDFVRQKYANGFFGPPGGTTYPGTGVAITEENRVSANKYLIMGQSNFNPGSSFVPYFTLGIGYMTFSIVNDLGEDIPKNMTGNYAMGAVIMPVGFGANYFLNDRFSMHAQGLFYINSTDYFDGYAHYTDFDAGGVIPGSPGSSATPSDYLASITIGASFTVFQPEPRQEMPPPLAADDVPDRAREQPRPPTTQADPAAPPQQELDSDGDNLSDRSEVERYMTDPQSYDSDGDNLSDSDEVLRTNTSPNNPDTDGDGLSDGAEALIHGTNPLDADSDNDLLSDGAEVRQHRTDPLKADTDGDGIADGQDDCPLEPGPAHLRGCPEGTVFTTAPLPTGSVADRPAYIIENNRVDFEGIYFQVNSDDFDFSIPETARNLQALLEYLQQCRDIGVVIEGHTSSEGNTDFNQTLSEKRARRVRNWLYSNGVATRKVLGTIGYGGRLPLVEEPARRDATAAELERIRRQNRRITALVRRPCG